MIRIGICCTALIFAAVICLSGICAGQNAGDGPHSLIPMRPMTQDVEILYGDPEKVGEPFVMRIRELPGGVIPPHRHPVDEHITVIEGTLFFAVGEKFDRAAVKELRAGSYAFIPKGSVMFGYTPNAAIVQVHGVGPFHIHWRAGSNWRDSLITLDSPAATSRFKFKRGDRVVTARGRGRIRQGYDSGEIIGYEIDGDKGSLFMAEEHQIRSSRKRQR
ncbi:MAG: cupin domain-containing protein [Pyrinomonadaceae bacterium]